MDTNHEPDPDMAELPASMEVARAAAEVAAAGRHNLLLVGPPGLGATMLARRVPTILSLTAQERDASAWHRALSRLPADDRPASVPFRAPHHTVSVMGLREELMLALYGVLYLDDVTEFGGAGLRAVELAVGALREAASARGSLPPILVIGSMRPCPCGWRGSAERHCACSSEAVQRHLGRHRDVLLQVFDISVSMRLSKLEELRGGGAGEGSAATRARVSAASQIARRWCGEPGTLAARLSRTVAALRGSPEPGEDDLRLGAALRLRNDL